MVVCGARLQVLVLPVNLHIALVRRAVALLAALHVGVLGNDISWRQLLFRLLHAHEPNKHKYD